MILISKRYRHVVLLTIFSAAVTWGSRADAEDAESVQKVVELNKKALAAYANLDVEEAINLLKQALENMQNRAARRPPGGGAEPRAHGRGPGGWAQAA